MDFLKLLRDLLREGLARCPADYRERHAEWLQARQRGGSQDSDPEAGGFANRRGNPELYYTTFGLRALSALNALSPEAALKCGRYLLNLRKRPGGAFADAVAVASWWDGIALCEEHIGNELIREARLEAAAVSYTRLNQLRRPDGGFAKNMLEGHGSLYHSFLAVSALYRMGREVPQADALRAFLKSMEQLEGGFLESQYSKRPGVNGSLAGLGLALMLEVNLDNEKHGAYLRGQRGSDGGFLATPNAPMEDLLSTFTGLLGLNVLGQTEAQTISRAVKYARSLEQPNGGYVGFALETTADCEYTFYGLGIEALGAVLDQQ